MSDALQSFLALAKGARGRAAAAVVADATAAPGLFAFGELLDVQGVKEARSGCGLRAAEARVTDKAAACFACACAAGGHGVCAGA